MINIRYHVLTVGAIFLALGIGILLGGTAGQSWFTEKEREILAEMEKKYDQAVRSNNELKQQVHRLIVQVEQNNQEVMHLMAARYTEDLNGETIYVWGARQQNLEQFRKTMTTVGIKVLEFRPGQAEDAYPLILFGAAEPEWVRTLPPGLKWIHVQTVPDSPAKQWQLLEDVHRLIRDKRWENEKS